MTSDLGIPGVEAIYLRLPQVKRQCDSGQDALIVRVTTDSGIVGYGEVDSNPMGAKGAIEGPFSHTTAPGLAHAVGGEDPFRTATEETGGRARRFGGQGFTAVKFGWDPMGQSEALDLALVREARKGLGD